MTVPDLCPEFKECYFATILKMNLGLLLIKRNETINVSKAVI